MIATLPGIRRVEHVMGMPIVLDARDEHVDDGGLERGAEVGDIGRP